MLHQMTMGKKLAMVTGGLIAVVLLMGVVAVQSLGSLNQTTVKIITDPLPGLTKITSVRAAVLEMRGDAWRHISSSDAAEMADLDQQITQLKAKADADLQDYQKTIFTPEGRAQFDKIVVSWQRYTEMLDGVLAISRVGSRNAEARAKYVNDGSPVFKAVRDDLAAAVELRTEQSNQLGAQSQQTYGSVRWMMLVLLFASILGGAGAAFAIIRSINTALRSAVNELSEGANQVASAASQVASSSQGLAQGSSEQAASLEETSASSEEINSMAQKNTTNSQEAAALVSQSQQKFAETGQSLDQMVAAMSEISAQSEKISKIIKVIDEIAFQTNILALNAAVEAARAGEAGMGFAVVADEVRNLAQRCAQAAKDTAALIEESITKSQDGKAKVDTVAAAIHAVTEQAAQVKTLVDEVNMGSQEQARGLDQISKAIVQMEQVTQKVAANAEESASAAEELNAQSESLKQVVTRLTSMVGGSGSHDDPAHRRTPESPAKKPAVQTRHESESSLSNLRKAVSPRAKAQVSVPVGVAHSAKQEFPLDEDFKEF